VGQNHKNTHLFVGLQLGNAQVSNRSLQLCSSDWPDSGLVEATSVDNSRLEVEGTQQSLSETVNIPSVFLFAECIPLGTRQRADLPSVVNKILDINIALGKKPNLPSVVYQTLGKQQDDTRQ